jgi:zinc/manganese transport system substrate-binding protein
MNAKAINGVAATAILIIGGIFMLTAQSPAATPATSGGKVLQIVAAENFWGSLVSQLGGTHVSVLSVVSDPNADPHEYETSTTDARAIAAADYVIVNGAGYDSWADKLLGAGGNTGRRVLRVADLLGKKEGDNPHFWYSPTYVNQVVAQMEQDLITADPTDADYYRQQYAALQSSLAGYQDQITSIKQQYSGTKVGATEDIFVYFADAAGLNLISPPAFIQAVAEGNDPPASSIVIFQNQVKAKQMKVLVYNTQTVTPLTESIKSLANAQKIPIIGISETTQPPTATFQDWMSMEVAALQNALRATAGR